MRNVFAISDLNAFDSFRFAELNNEEMLAIDGGVGWDDLFFGVSMAAGGIIGAQIGAAVGTGVCPVIGTIVGGVVGGLLYMAADSLF